MILVIDNYDSFVYNLSRYVVELGLPCEVRRNDQISLSDISNAIKPSHIILSPGPCTPNEAGICLQVVKHFAGRIPILGVCLGHQVIGQALGGEIVQAVEPSHGKASVIEHDGRGIFCDVKNPLQVGRYHSLVVAQHNLPRALHINAVSQYGDIMAFQHREAPLFGVQFHPESILTDNGHKLLHNFLNLISVDGVEQV